MSDQEKKLPELKVVFDPEAKSVGLEFKVEDFVNWEFVLAVLRMAVERAKQQRNMAIMENMRKAQESAALMERLRRNGN